MPYYRLENYLNYSFQRSQSTFYKLNPKLLRFGFAITSGISFALLLNSQAPTECLSLKSLFGGEYGEKRVNDLFSQVDFHFQNQEFGKMYTVLKNHYTELHNNPNYMIKLAIACFYISQTPGCPAANVTSFIKEGLSYAEKSLSSDPLNPTFNKWFSILLYHEIMGNFAMFIGNSLTLKIMLEKSVDFNPADMTLRYYLLRVMYDLATVPKFIKSLAIFYPDMFFIPSIDEVQYQIEETERIAKKCDVPLTPEILYLSGLIYMRKNMKEFAKKYWTLGSKMTPKTEDEKEAVEKMISLVSKLTL